MRFDLKREAGRGRWSRPIAATRVALAQGADMVVIDVTRSADGVLHPDSTGAFPR